MKGIAIGRVFGLYIQFTKVHVLRPDITRNPHENWLLNKNQKFLLALDATFSEAALLLDCSSVIQFVVIFLLGHCLCLYGDEPYTSDARSAASDQRDTDVEQPVHREVAAQRHRRRGFQDLRTLGETQREPEQSRSV